MQVAKAQAMEKIESDRQIEAMVPVKKPRYTTEIKLETLQQG